MIVEMITELLFKGRLALNRGDLDTSARIFKKIISVDGACADAWISYGMTLLAWKKPTEAYDALQTAKDCNGSNQLLFQAFGQFYIETGQYEKALEEFKAILELSPDSADAWYAIGHCYLLLGDTNHAIDSLKNAANLKGKLFSSSANNLLAHAYLATGDYDLAAKCVQRAMVEDPTRLEFLMTKFEIQWGTGNIASAEKTIRNVINLHPAEPGPRSAKLMALKYSINTTLAEIYQNSREWFWYIGAGADVQTFPVADRQDNNGKRRIGYVSPDFAFHSVGFIIHDLLSLHDRGKFEIYCYSCSKKHDAMTAAIINVADVWRDISTLDDQAAADLIAADELDCLIDLAGHAANNRLGVFTRHPAKMQISWLGYAHTTGLRSIDIFISDGHSVLPDEEKYFAEKVEKLSFFRIPFVPPRMSPEVVEPPFIDNGYITFGSFNNVAKYNDEVIAAWATVLKSVPDSRLILKWKSFASRSVRERIYRKFSAHGISRRRLELREESTQYLMLIEYGEVDIALDPFPFSGCLTTYLAIWMGIPVITLQGITPIGRQTAAINRELGLDFLTAQTIDDYVNACLMLAMQKDRLSELRATLRGRLVKSRLADLKMYVDSLESIYVRFSRNSFPHEMVPRDEYPALTEVAQKFVENGNIVRAEQIASLLNEAGYVASDLSIINAMINFKKNRRSKAIKLLQSLTKHEYNEKALFNLAKMYDRMHLIHDAINCYKKMLCNHYPKSTITLLMAKLLMNYGRTAEAIPVLENLVRKNPTDDSIAAYLYALNYTDTLPPEQICLEHKKLGSRLQSARKQNKWKNSPSKERKLRVGYVSPDFGAHPVSYFLLEVFKNHSKDSFDTYCYSNRAIEDDLTCFFRDHSDNWRTVWKVSASELAKTINYDAIDILIDLAGYTKGHRLDLFSLKPAPIQISWLGYPNTTGLSTIDYRITDAIADPPGKADTLHSEQLIRLPSSFLCYYPPPLAPRPGKPPQAISGFTTFGSFNNLAKITPGMITLWSKILLRTNGAKLIIKRDVFKDPMVRSYFKDCFAACGVGADMLNLVVHKHDINSHMGEYRQIDIALDSFPYNGTTTTCEALWMGVPVVTMAGDRHAARVGASILTNIGLAELVAQNSDDYIDIAVSLAHDHRRREDIRTGLRKRMSGSILMDGPQFTRNLEDAYRDVWSRWCEQQNGEGE